MKKQFVVLTLLALCAGCAGPFTHQKSARPCAQTYAQPIPINQPYSAHAWGMPWQQA